MRGDFHVHPPRETLLCAHGIDRRVDLCHRAGDHGLPRRQEAGQAHLGVVGEQLFGRVGVHLQQTHRALAGQLRHQPRTDPDDPQALAGGQRPGHHGRGHFSHRMPNHRIGFHTV